MTVNNSPGQLVGRRADPSMILEGIGNPDDETCVYACDGHGKPLSDRLARPLFVVACGLGGICVMSITAGIVGVAFGHAIENAIRSFTMVPIATAMGLVAIAKERSFDRECDGRRFLVRRGSHIVYMKSYLTLRATEGIPEPVVCLSIVHAIMRKGTATKGIGGVHLSCAGTYQMEVTPEKAERAVIHANSFQGEGEAILLDCFEAPLQDVLGEWLEDAPWAWLMPLTPKDAVSPAK